ncbi:MAG: oligosaccharide flippase family protein [Bacteroidales bacterium]|nr:oligosaccharide flippase family protein [Bacteroidales bacterium]
MPYIQYFKDFFTKGHKRTIAAKKNIAASIVIKGINIGIGLAIVPLTISYIDPTKYGIWITLSSLVAWFGFFDIGLGHGLRNRFAEALAKEDHNLAKVYVSTTYAILSVVIFVVITLFLLVNQFINWNAILNAETNIVSGAELSKLAAVVFVLFCLSFILKLITTILTADQKPALASVFDMLGRLFALIIIYILTKTTNGSLLMLGIVYSSMPVVVLTASSLWFFNGRYKKYKPTFKNIDFKQASQLLNLGIKFFIIQITGVIFYQTNAIIIAQMFGPAEVTVYSVTFQYFSVFTSVFSILLTPYWSAFTEAYAKKDFEWIKNHVAKLKKISFVMIFLVLLALVAIQFIFELWVGNKVKVNFGLSLTIALYVILTTINSVNCQFMNGVSKIKLQLMIAIGYSIIHIPLSIFLCREFGIKGVMISASLIVFSSLILYEIQYKKIVAQKAKGIWDT